MTSATGRHPVSQRFGSSLIVTKAYPLLAGAAVSDAAGKW